MKKIICFVFCIAAFSSFGANNAFFGTTDSDWFTGSNWQLGSAPGATDGAIFPAAKTAVISGGSASVANAFVGNGGGAAGYDATANKTTVTVGSTGSLTVSSELSVIKDWSAHEVYADVEIVQNGGTVTVGNNMYINQTQAKMDAKGTTSASGTYTFNGGTLDVGNFLYMGQTTSAGLTATLAIMGTSADTITAKNFSLGLVDAAHDDLKTAFVDFHVGNLGTTTLRNDGDWFTIAETTKVTVDLSAYSLSGDNTFILMEQTFAGRSIAHGQWEVADLDDLVIQGYDAELYDVSVEFGTGSNGFSGSTLELNISQVPEPATIGMMLFGGVAVFVSRRLRQY